MEKILILSVSYPHGKEYSTNEFSKYSYEWLREKLDEDWMVTIYQGTQEDLTNAINDYSHSSHYLSQHCVELCLGDFV